MFECKEEIIDGLKQIAVENGNLRMVVVPGQGGRIVEFSTQGYNVLYRNPELIGVKWNGKSEQSVDNWLNFGGYKAWPAPQNIWQWPPIFDLDLGEYEYKIEKSENLIHITLTSPVSKELKLQFQRDIRVKDNVNYIDVEEKMISHNEDELYCTVWDNTQVITPGYAEIQLSSNVFSGGVTFYQDFDIPSKGAYSISRNTNSGRKVLKINCNQSEKFKVGIVSDYTVVSYTCEAYDSKIVYKKTFDFDGEVVYPHGSNIEIYSDTTLPYAEVEVLKGMKHLKKDESVTLKVRWELNIE